METNQLDERNDYWMQQVTAWKASGMPQTTFCKKHELVYHQFIYWKLKFEGSSQPAPTVSKKSGFVRVHPEPSVNHGDSGLALSLPNGVMLKGLSNTNLNLACQLIKQLS